jgi:hypothetical protein
MFAAIPFLRAFNGLDPDRRQSAMRSYAKAEAFCEAKTRHPLVKPGPIDARRAQKANWSNAAKLAKLAEAYVVAGGDDDKAARILGVSRGSAPARQFVRRAASRRVGFSPAVEIRDAASGTRSNGSPEERIGIPGD